MFGAGYLESHLVEITKIRSQTQDPQGFPRILLVLQCVGGFVNFDYYSEYRHRFVSKAAQGSF